MTNEAATVAPDMPIPLIDPARQPVGKVLLGLILLRQFLRKQLRIRHLLRATIGDRGSKLLLSH
jgi:hypothetical protein